MKFIIFLIFSLALSYGASTPKRRLLLHVVKHQPCNLTPSKSERLRFPPIEQAPVEEDPDRGDGCYLISGSGDVNVSKPITGTVQVYSEIKYGTKAPSEKCRNANSAGCGGVGSCVYCRVCTGIKNITDKADTLVHLETGSGKKLNCKKGLQPGEFSDIRISFCMPTKDEFLKTENMDEQFWNQYVSTGQLFFVTLYIFNEPVNQLSRTELQQISTPEGEKVIGCHRMVGTVSEQH